MNGSGATTPTKAQVAAGVGMVLAVGRAVIEAGRIPEGHLYAVCMGSMDLEAFERIVGILEAQHIIRREGHELVALITKGGAA